MPVPSRLTACPRQVSSAPLVVRAKLEIAGGGARPRQGAPALCGHGVQRRAGHAGRRTPRRARVWLHAHVGASTPRRYGPSSRPFRAPTRARLKLLQNIIAAAARRLGPISFGGQLHDRASYRYYWQVLERAHQTGKAAARTTCGAGSRPRALTTIPETTHESPHRIHP